MKESFQDLLDINKGHFLLESGLHGDVWFDLEKTFLRPETLRPFTDKLADLLSGYELSAVCGAMVGGAFIAYAVAESLGIDFLYTERHVKASLGAPYEVSYTLPHAIRGAAVNRRVAIVDDVINAGSAVTKTYGELRAHGAHPVAFACILTVGGPSPKRLPGEYPPIVSLEHLTSSLWKPGACPLCQSGMPLVDPYDASQRIHP